MTKQIPTPKALRIGHGGDFHFFQNKRHEESDQLTDTLCDLIVKEKIDLFYFGGDIVDSKTKLSPEQVRSIKRLVKKVTDLVPTVWILGNHDLNLKNRHRLDSLTPFLEDIDTKHPIHFLKHSGIYNLYDINWAVWSCLDDQTNPFIGVDPKDIKPGYVIGCYHGAINGVVADNDVHTMKADTEVEEFKDCGSVFLNDIHKRQSFRDGDIQYSGSWTQTKISEEESKGILIWDWNEKKSKFEAEYAELPKNFGYRTYEVKDLAKFKFPKDELPRTYISRILYTGDANDFSPVLFEGLKQQLQKRVDTAVIAQNKPFNSKKVITATKKDKKTDFFEEYFKGLEYTKEAIAVLKEIDTIYSKMVDNSDYEIGEYTIEEVTVHNFMSYGPDNVIDWTKIKGIVGLFAPNRTGKSTLLDAIMFCLFNKTSRIAKPGREIINDQIEEGEAAFVEIKATINGSKWRVKRTITPTKKTSVSTALEVYELIADKEVPRHKEDRIKTEPVLRKLFGDSEVFLITALCTQKKPVEFVDCPNADRLDLFLKFLGITAYEQKHEFSKKDLEAKQIQYEAAKKGLEGIEDETKLKEEIAGFEDTCDQKKVLMDGYERIVLANDKQVKQLRELLENLQVVEVAKSKETLDEEMKVEEISLAAKKEQFLEIEKVLANRNEWWMNNVGIVKPVEWKEDETQTKPLNDKLSELGQELGALKLYKSGGTIEQWEEDKANNRKTLDEKELALEKLEKERIDNLDEWKTLSTIAIETWEPNTKRDDELSISIASHQFQIKGLEDQLNSTVCPTCLQPRKIDTVAIGALMQIQKDLLQKDNGELDIIKTERNKLVTLQKAVSKTDKEIAVLEKEIRELSIEETTIANEILQLSNNSLLEGSRKKVETKIAETNQTLDKIKVVNSSIVTIQKEIAQHEANVQLASLQIDLSKNKIKGIKQDLETIEANKANKEQRDKLKTQIQDLEIESSTNQSLKRDEEIAIVSLKQEITKRSDQITSTADKRKAILQIEREIMNLQAYVKAMHRSGVPFIILETYIPDINFEINDNLQGLFDFTVFFELSEKTLDIYFADTTIKHNKRTVAQTSGLEGFAINLAIRAALTRISLLPKPSIFMIDEGFGVGDQDNIEPLKELLYKFRNQYRNIVMITHLDDLKDFPEHYISLEKKDGVTSIVV